ncbi:MAG TPA: copper resistance protein CopC, partial [Acidimicrobiia bacterium]|nr:copper resistance protein CopC [Acidimicrobiia bacterium]
MLRPAVAVAAVFTTVVAVVVGTASPAAAHPRLRLVEPAANDTVAGPLGHVTLRFTEAVDWELSRVAVTDSDGASVLAGPPEADGIEARFPLRSDAFGA